MLVKWKRLRPPKKVVSRKLEVVITSSRIIIFEKFQFLYMSSTNVSQMEAFATSNGVSKKKRKKLKLYHQLTFLKNSKSYACFRLWQVQRDCLRPLKMVPRKPEVVITLSPINILKKKSNSADVFNYGQASYVTLAVTLRLQRLCCLWQMRSKVIDKVVCKLLSHK